MKLQFGNRLKRTGPFYAFEAKYQDSLHFTRILVTCFGLALPGAANALSIYNPGTLDFESTNQSMWGPGGASAMHDSVFLGQSWANETATIGGIIGDGLARTGAQLDITSSGKAGLEFGYTIDSGSVNSTVGYSALAELPDQVLQNTFFNLNPSSSLKTGTLESQSPKLDAYISAVMKMQGSVSAEACLPIVGCTSGMDHLPNVDMDQRILSIDPNSLKILDGVLPGGAPLAQLPILNQSLTLEAGATAAPPTVGFKLSGPYGATPVDTLPSTPSVSVDLAELSVHVPDIATSGGISGDKLTSSGSDDDFLSLKLDVDGAATIFGGLPPLGASFSLIDTPVAKLEASLDLIDVDAGPDLGMKQDLELTPTLMVDLAFDKPVQIAGMSGLQTGWSGMWDSLPDFALLQTTTFSPTFWLDAMLHNEFGLNLGLSGTLDVLKLGATASVGGLNLFDIGPISLNGLMGLGNTLFATDKLNFSVYNDEFSFGGFKRVAGNPFTLSLLDSRNVSEPSMLWLLLPALAGVFATRKRRQTQEVGGFLPC